MVNCYSSPETRHYPWQKTRIRATTSQRRSSAAGVIKLDPGKPWKIEAEMVGELMKQEASQKVVFPVNRGNNFEDMGIPPASTVLTGMQAGI